MNHSSERQPAPSEDILLVDDTLDNLRVLMALLRQRGYSVRGVATGSAALMGASAQPPDLVLLDINMPEMSGYEVCQRLKQDPKTKHIPIIFISALNEVFDKVKAFTIGGVDYITKPFQVEEVFARVENQLALQRLQTQLLEQNQRLQATELDLSKALEQERLLNEKVAEMTTLEERHRIARDIHDSLGHALVALNIQLEAALALWSDAPDQAYASLQESKKLGSEALTAVRASVSDMRSDTLQGKLLEQALQDIIQEFQLATQVIPKARIDLSFPFPSDVNVVLYRIVQEGFTNICKHAEATAVDLNLHTSATDLRLTITDNGKGFCAHHSQTGFGLQSMRERVAALGGTFTIQSVPGEGCQLAVHIPRMVA